MAEGHREKRLIVTVKYFLDSFSSFVGPQKPNWIKSLGNSGLFLWIQFEFQLQLWALFSALTVWKLWRNTPSSLNPKNNFSVQVLCSPIPLNLYVENENRPSPLTGWCLLGLGSSPPPVAFSLSVSPDACVRSGSFSHQIYLSLFLSAFDWCSELVPGWSQS